MSRQFCAILVPIILRGTLSNVMELSLNAILLFGSLFSTFCLHFRVDEILLGQEDTFKGTIEAMLTQRESSLRKTKGISHLASNYAIGVSHLPSTSSLEERK